MSLVIAWGITPIDRRTLSDSVAMSNPLTVARPDVGAMSVVSIRMSVDFPAPFGPSRPKTSPSSTSKVTPLTAVKSPKRLTRSRTSMACIDDLPRDRQQDVRGLANRQAAIAIVGAQPDLERPDVALGPADIPLRRKARVGAAVEHRAIQFRARGQADRQVVTELDLVDVALLDVHPHPEIVGIDDRHDGLARGDDLALTGRTDVDDAVDGRVNLRVGEADVGFLLLRRGGR